MTMHHEQVLLMSLPVLRSRRVERPSVPVNLSLSLAICVSCNLTSCLTIRAVQSHQSVTPL